jgi:hypothetical protein
VSESSITPLAQRLAEENNVDWKALQGSGPDGRIIERDVLDFLARVMAGDEELNPTPEPLPDGLASWDAAEGVQDVDDWFSAPAAEPEREPAEAEPAATPDFELSDDIFLFDDESDDAAEDGEDDGLLLFGGETAEPDAAQGFTLSLDEDDGFDLFGNARSTTAGAYDDDSDDLADLGSFGREDFGFADQGRQASASVQEAPGLAITEADDSLGLTGGLLDDDFYEDDFLTDLALEDGELDSPEAADADLNEFGLTGGFASGGYRAADSSDGEAGDLLAGSSGSDAHVQDDDLWIAEPEPLPAEHEPRLTLRQHLQEDAPAVKDQEPAAAGGFEVDFGDLAAEDADTDAAVAALLPPAIPLVSHGALLRRHADVTLLTQARQAAGVELGQGEPAPVLPFLLRAAARAAHLLGGDTTGVGAALILPGGVRVEHIADAADGSFGDLALYLIGLANEPVESGSHAADGEQVSVIACDMSALQVDEAVLHLGSPVLTLGRILSDSEQGTNHSTLTLSGTFDITAGAEFLQSVSDLLASPVRLLI